jgi:hypothetical protein
LVGDAMALALVATVDQVAQTVTNFCHAHQGADTGSQIWW